MKAKHYALLIAGLHLILGNLIAFVMIDSFAEILLLYVFFLPYTFIWGVASMVGHDWLSLWYTVLGFGVWYLLFYPLAWLIANRKRN